MRRLAGIAAGILAAACPVHAATLSIYARAYPQTVAAADGSGLTLRDGTRLPAGPAQADKPFAFRLTHASLIDQLAMAYPRGPLLAPPASDPGRLRNKAFFDAVYGDCHKSDVSRNLVPVVWLPRHWGHRVMFTRLDGAAAALRAVSSEIDAMPPAIRKAAYPTQGTYNCRGVADGGQPSMHAYGAAIDLAEKASDYWLWEGGETARYRNRMPAPIVAAFERHGFIWGGKWRHYDTMHFEYRPELLLAADRR